jgi:GSH-dependent disulfide-bond oxidoreductase
MQGAGAPGSSASWPLSAGHAAGPESITTRVARDAVELYELPGKFTEKDRTVIDLYTWTTPNGRKVSIALEEMGLPYTVHAVDISKDEQFKPEFLKISPNNRIPAIVDRDNGLSLMESGAILTYLGDKTGKLLPKSGDKRWKTIEWLNWQMGGVGPMFGQVHHYTKYNPGKAPYAEERYLKEAHRLYGVLDRRLADHEYMAGAYSIADMATYPWIVPYERQGQNLDDFPHIKRWFTAIKARPAVERAYAKAKEINPNAGGIRTAEERAILFGQTAASVQAAVR